MGWTGQTLRVGETVRDILMAAYQGDPNACASCAWPESAHPRVSGSEYDAIYGPRDDRPAAHDFVASVPRYRVLDYAQVALTEVYLAVETIETGEIWAGVALVRRMRSAEVTYKDMSETMGPNAVRCPVRILDRLTPTTSENAVEWRAACRARVAKLASRPAVGAGSRLRFAQPLTFSNGTTRDTFEMVKGSTFRAVEIEEGRAQSSSTRYHVANWRELTYSLA